MSIAVDSLQLTVGSVLFVLNLSSDTYWIELVVYSVPQCNRVQYKADSLNVAR